MCPRLICVLCSQWAAGWNVNEKQSNVSCEDVLWCFPWKHSCLFVQHFLEFQKLNTIHAKIYTELTQGGFARIPAWDQKSHINLKVTFCGSWAPKPEEAKIFCVGFKSLVQFSQAPSALWGRWRFFWPVNPQADTVSCSEDSDDLGHGSKLPLFSSLSAFLL